jgi:hypothetical protein
MVTPAGFLRDYLPPARRMSCRHAVAASLRLSRRNLPESINPRRRTQLTNAHAILWEQE